MLLEDCDDYKVTSQLKSKKNKRQRDKGDEAEGIKRRRGGAY